jgi:predicted enzyme related to lactoylglutathione lyase
MGDRSSYASGTFCWTDLATSDPERARRLYAELFGWQPEGSRPSPAAAPTPCCVARNPTGAYFALFAGRFDR